VAYYLKMDGVDDRLNLPSMTFTEIVMDFKCTRKRGFDRYWSLPFSAEYFQIASGDKNDQWSAGVSALYLNGIAQTNLTPFITLDTRVTVRSVFSAAKTSLIYIYSNNTSSAMQGVLYGIKIYNGATLVASYDMTLGNVQDQSGNGRHATLIGGTWIEDGPSGVDVSYAYSTKQSLYANRTAALATAQRSYAVKESVAPTSQRLYVNLSHQSPLLERIYSDRTASLATLQRLYAGGQMDAPTVQRISIDRSYSYPMLQVITDSEGKDVSYYYALRQVISAERQTDAPTMQQLYAMQTASVAMRQIIYANQSIPFATKQRFFVDRAYVYSMLIRIGDLPDDPEIIRHVTLRGDRQLVVRLRGARRLSVRLVCARQLIIRLNGGVDVTARNQSFRMVSGDTTEIEIINPTDLTGATVKWLLHKSGNQYISKSTPAITVTSGEEESIIKIKLDPADTENLKGVYYHEAEVTDSFGNISTVTMGSVTIEKGYIN